MKIAVFERYDTVYSGTKVSTFRLSNKGRRVNWYLPTRLHGVTSQKTVIPKLLIHLVVTAFRLSRRGHRGCN
jgi:hypothetical protein